MGLATLGMKSAIIMLAGYFLYCFIFLDIYNLIDNFCSYVVLFSIFLKTVK